MGFTKAILSGDSLEIYEYQKNIQEKRSRNTKSKRYPRIYTLERRDDNLRKQKNYVRRIIRSNLVGAENPSLCTLTLHTGVSVKTSWLYHGTFVQRIKKRFGKSIKLISVLEYQKRGVIHFHSLIWGIPEPVVTYEFARRSRILQNQWLRGTLDIRPTDGNPALAHYVTKYLSKQMLDPRLIGEKSYVCTRNMLRPVHASSNKKPYQDGLIPNTPPLQERVFDTTWLGQCTYKLYKITMPHENDNSGIGNEDVEEGE